MLIKHFDLYIDLVGPNYTIKKFLHLLVKQIVKVTSNSTLKLVEPFSLQYNDWDMVLLSKREKEILIELLSKLGTENKLVPFLTALV